MLRWVLSKAALQVPQSCALWRKILPGRLENMFDILHLHGLHADDVPTNPSQAKVHTCIKPGSKSSLI